MSKTVPVTLNVNGVEHHLDVEPRLLLVHALRDHLGLDPLTPLDAPAIAAVG